MAETVSRSISDLTVPYYRASLTTLNCLILGAFTAAECANYLRHAGYASVSA
jgi:hypothetical protein